MLPYFDNPRCFTVFHLDRDDLNLKAQIMNHMRILSAKSKPIGILWGFLLRLYSYLHK